MLYKKPQCYCVVLVLAVVIPGWVFPAKAGLPKLSEGEFLELIAFTDSMVKNVSFEYSVDEVRSEERLAKVENSGLRISPMQSRRWDVEWRKEEEKYYFDLTLTDKENEIPTVYNIDAYDGQYRRTLVPNESRGDIFGSPVTVAFPAPLDFCISFGDRDKGLAMALGEGRIERLGQEDWEGHECFLVEATLLNTTRLQAWIDPQIGYRARHIKQYGRGELFYEAWVEFEEAKKDIWLPVSGIARMYSTNKDTGQLDVEWTRTLKVSKAKANEELTLEDFSIKYPVGTRVFDNVYGIGYTVGTASPVGIGEASLSDIAQAARGAKEVRVTDGSPDKATLLRREVASQNAEQASSFNNDKINRNRRLLPWTLVMAATTVGFAFAGTLCYWRKRDAVGDAYSDKVRDGGEGDGRYIASDRQGPAGGRDNGREGVQAG